mmetsp:Transcript_5478/g.13234  ORF Transcript_5478/g.13234 Transcript_5478/m.13234 type:complete len:311 (-) Transcript_5478:345-1277(-)
MTPGGIVVHLSFVKIKTTRGRMQAEMAVKSTRRKPIVRLVLSVPVGRKAGEISRAMQKAAWTRLLLVVHAVVVNSRLVGQTVGVNSRQKTQSTVLTFLCSGRIPRGRLVPCTGKLSSSARSQARMKPRLALTQRVVLVAGEEHAMTTLHGMTVRTGTAGCTQNWSGAQTNLRTGWAEVGRVRWAHWRVLLWTASPLEPRAASAAEARGRWMPCSSMMTSPPMGSGTSWMVNAQSTMMAAFRAPTTQETIQTAPLARLLLPLLMVLQFKLRHSVRRSSMMYWLSTISGTAVLKGLRASFLQARCSGGATRP